MKLAAGNGRWLWIKVLWINKAKSIAKDRLHNAVAIIC